METHRSVLFDVVDGVAWITLNRRAALNAVDGLMAAELREAWECLGTTPGVRAAVVIGAGAEAFSLGLDRSHGALPAPADSLEPPPLAVPLVAAVNGIACAEAYGLVCRADRAVAARHARLSRARPALPQRGRGRTMMSAREARLARIVDTVVPLPLLRQEADAVARRLALTPAPDEMTPSHPAGDGARPAAPSVG
ncbi:hypothetical protein PZ61_0235910 [Streptomyces sp. MNU77]|uniref:enoyl-CoA hydratase/isomerase family protein n=1 Tax=Streptomyces sp. MNU77 TaxID=1573406 RepID=UPI0006977BE8|nr:enoyl-CoA hydratase/isomerase family protein [Streptomyces sp. MNU77]OLO25821.1 hypothetical protein PZ61_0235910 [Streptomyces sp. MNU77]